LPTQLHLTEAALPDYLRSIGVLGPGDTVSVEKAGDGNINWVRRARAASEDGAEGHSTRSWIVKQARPALERFPEYQVDTARIVFEHRWYEAVAPFDAEGVCPAVHGFREEDRVLVLEDLGDAPRLDRLLREGADLDAPLATLAAFLGRVHAATRDPGWCGRFANDAMRRLHGEHIFVLPLRENDFDLAPAVAAEARRWRADRALVAAADAAHARYLEPRGALVHGDVQAGNVLLTGRGPKLLDAEIAHVGDPAFDVGTLLAHLALCPLARGTRGGVASTASALWDAYRGSHGEEGLAGFSDVTRYAGLEMMRRTLGAARVEAVATEEASLRVLSVAEGWVRHPPAAPAALP